MNEYEVTMSVHMGSLTDPEVCTMTITVWAENEEEAEASAREKFLKEMMFEVEMVEWVDKE